MWHFVFLFREVMGDQQEPSVEKLSVEDSNGAPEDDVVDPWTVTSTSDSGVDYDKLISKLLTFLLWGW